MANVKCGTGANVGVDTDFILHPKTADEIKLLGINNAQIPGWETELITDDSFDLEIAGAILGSLSYTPAAFTAYMRSRDPSQEAIRVYSKERTQFSDLWIVYNRKQGHFWALDLAADPCGFCGISGYAPQAYARNDLISVQFTLTVNGASGLFEYHTPSLAYAIEDGVLTATGSGSDFTALGFRKGMSLIMETGDADAPLLTGIVASVTANTITLTDLTVDLTSGTGAIHGAVVDLPSA